MNPDLAEPPLHEAALPAKNHSAGRDTLVLAAAYFLFFITPLGLAGAIPRTCLWYKLTGLDCPFCGLVRSLIATAHGSLRVAYAFHPLGPVVFAAGMVLLGVAAYRWTAGRSFDLFEVVPGGRRTVLLAAWAWLVWWLARIF